MITKLPISDHKSLIPSAATLDPFARGFNIPRSEEAEKRARLEPDDPKMIDSYWILANDAAPLFPPFSLLNEPCIVPFRNTLHIKNLPIDILEEELTSIFTSHQGYVRTSFRGVGNRIMCQVEFTDEMAAMKALNKIDGLSLHSSTGAEIRLTFDSQLRNAARLSTTTDSTSAFPAGEAVDSSWLQRHRELQRTRSLEGISSFADFGRQQG